MLVKKARVAAAASDDGGEVLLHERDERREVLGGDVVVRHAEVVQVRVERLDEERVVRRRRRLAAVGELERRWRHWSTRSPSRYDGLAGGQKRWAHLQTARHWSGFLSSLFEYCVAFVARVSYCSSPSRPMWERVAMHETIAATCWRRVADLLLVDDERLRHKLVRVALLARRVGGERALQVEAQRERRRERRHRLHHRRDECEQLVHADLDRLAGVRARLDPPHGAARSRR